MKSETSIVMFDGLMSWKSALLLYLSFILFCAILSFLFHKIIAPKKRKKGNQDLIVSGRDKRGPDKLKLINRLGNYFLGIVFTGLLLISSIERILKPFYQPKSSSNKVLVAFFAFLDGLKKSYTWHYGQENAMLGTAPSWLYLPGLVINFLFASLLVILISHYLYFVIQKWRKKCKSRVKAKYDKAIESTLKKVTASILVFPIVFIIFCLFLPIFAPHRLVNGIWRYHYFSQQKTSQRVAQVTRLDSTLGRRASSPSIDMTMTIDGNVHQVHVVNPSSETVHAFRDKYRAGSMTLKVRVNDKDQIVFID